MKILKLLALLLCLPLAAQGQSHSYPGPFLALRGRVFFPAQEASTGREMWVSDGTVAGTELLADAFPGERSSDPVFLEPGAGGVFWTGLSPLGSPLWWSDGTRAGTRALREDEQLQVALPYEGPGSVLMGGILYFVGCPGGRSCSLWRSDGSEEGTRPVVASSPWASGSVGSLRVAGSRLFFVAGEDLLEPALWTTDGTEAGTRLVKRLEGYPRWTAATADRLFFLKDFYDEGRQELWTSDGTEAGTRKLGPDFLPDIPWLKTVGRRIYFSADDGRHDLELWRSDGTAAGTERVTSFDYDYDNPFVGVFSPWQLEELGDRVVFLATDGLSNVKLWAATGPRGRPFALAEICSHRENCRTIEPDWRLIKIGNRVVFRGTDPEHGAEIWSTDGRVSGTRRLSDACRGACSGVTAEPVLSGSAAWFATVARRRDPRLELWTSDGTAGETRRVLRLETAGLVDELRLATARRKVFFSAGLELWVSDGTAAGTLRLHEFQPGPFSSQPGRLGSAADTAAF